jgi:hypothetical protein
MLVGVLQRIEKMVQITAAHRRENSVEQPLGKTTGTWKAYPSSNGVEDDLDDWRYPAEGVSPQEK